VCSSPSLIHRAQLDRDIRLGGRTYTDTKTHPARAAQAAAMVHLVETAARTPQKS
jgi:hypothetical protein